MGCVHLLDLNEYLTSFLLLRPSDVFLEMERTSRFLEAVEETW